MDKKADPQQPSAEQLVRTHDNLVWTLDAVQSYVVAAEGAAASAVGAAGSATVQLWLALCGLEREINPDKAPCGTSGRRYWGTMSGWPMAVATALQMVYDGSEGMLAALGWQNLSEGRGCGILTCPDGVLSVPNLPDGMVPVSGDWTWPQLPPRSVAKLCRALEMLSAHLMAGEPSTVDGPAHGPDFRSVLWCGKTHTFTELQAACIKVLWEAWEHGTPEVGEKTILSEVEAQGDRLRDIFAKGAHEAWGRMIVAGETRGSFRLAGKKPRLNPRTPDIPPRTPQGST